MKKSVDIIGLPVIDISEGTEIGTVTKLIINPTEGTVAALVIDAGTWYPKLLPFSKISGIGESALTIISNNDMLTVDSSPDLLQLLIAEIAIIGTKVLTKTGDFQGIVKEIFIEMSGKIADCEVEEPNGQVITIPAEKILTFGKKVLIIGENTEVSTAATPTLSLTTNPITAESTPEPTPIIETIPEPVATPEIVEVALPEIKVPEEIPAAVTTKPAKENSNDDSARKFDEKQRKYLLGKQASRRIETDNGVVIVEQGGEINEEVLQKAKLAGKFVELSMNIQ